MLIQIEVSCYLDVLRSVLINYHSWYFFKIKRMPENFLTYLLAKGAFEIDVARALSVIIAERTYARKL